MMDLEGFFQEDLGARGDITSRAVLKNPNRPARARVFTRERVVVAGLLEAADVFAHQRVDVRPRAQEGAWLPPGGTLLDLRGPIGGILVAERLGLNILGRMVGIATKTRRLQDRVAAVNPACRVAGTRKTTPGFRALEKRAIALGGGEPHRYGLYDGILIKDNHLAAVGSVSLAIARARMARLRLPIEVEVSTLMHARSAARAGADWLLIDNIPAALARRIAVSSRRLRPGLRVECSGGLTPRTLLRYAAFTDRLSLGSLTHSAVSADVSLELVGRKPVKP